jgi:hypothetical protein
MKQSSQFLIASSPGGSSRRDRLRFRLAKIGRRS